MEFNQDWRDWVLDNLARGCTQASMLEVMQAQGFGAAEARAIVLLYAERRSELALAPTAVAAAANYQPTPLPTHSWLDGGDRQIRVACRSERPQVLVLDGVLSNEECDEVVRRAGDKLRRSTIVDPQTGREEVIAARSSEGTYFNLCEDEFITRLDQRIARLMGHPLAHGEGLQILRYGVGGEYRPHHDYFPPEDPGSAPHLAQGGQRVATLVVYLNDVPAGGATAFPDAGLHVLPRKGSAVMFRYVDALGRLDPLTLHAGEPVTEGEKWIMTKWVRQAPYAA
nr:2OG-Fe(II) oxygenase [uncultured Roseateles sp.]